MKKKIPVYKSIIIGICLMISSSIYGQVANPVADASIKAFNDAFLMTSNGRTYYKNALNSTEHDGTWTLALDIFGMQDTYERTGSEDHKKIINDLCNGFLQFNPTPYSWDGWNDDLAWMGLALARGYQITGSPNQLAGAEHSFNLAYDRGWNTVFNNGGIWEQQPDMTPADGGINKEALSNNPNGNLAVLLYESTGNQEYLDKAIKIYDWSRSHIFNPDNGQVYANIDRADVQNKSTAVYNQGSFIDFAASLYRITGNELMLKDAQMAADYVIQNMTKNGIVSNTAEYLNTWADTYARGLGHLCMWNPQLWNKYYSFIKKNADAAWKNRRTDLNLCWNGWDQKTPTTKDSGPTVYVSAMVMQQWTPTVQAIPDTIEAENYNFMNGISTEDISGGKCIGSIEAGDWIEYLVNVPATGIYTITLQVSGTTAGSIEIQQNNVSLATVDLPSTGDLQTYTTVKTAVKLSSGIQSVKLKSISGVWTIDKWMATSCQAITPSIAINGAVAEQITSATLSIGDNLFFDPQPTDGTWSWTGPNGFVSNSRQISVDNIQFEQGGVYTAKYLSPDACINIQDFMIPLNGCSPTAIVGYMQANDGEIQQVDSVNILAGSLLTIDPQPLNGTWSWTGPNNFAANTRKISFLSMANNQAGNYTATYFNPGGCKTSRAFKVVLNGPDPCGSEIIPYINVNNVKWEKVAYASVNSGGSFTFGPQPTEGTWKWTGPNGFTSNAREFTITGFNATKSGHYQATYTNTSGCSSTMDFIIGLKGCNAVSIVPEIEVNGVLQVKTDSISIVSGGNLSITFPELDGLWSWTGPNGFTSNSRQIFLDKILSWKNGRYNVNFVDVNNCINTYIIDIIVVGDDYLSTPIVPYIQINNGTWQNTSTATLNQGGKIIFGPQPNKNMWIWSGPDGFTANTREVTISNINVSQSGIYSAVYTNNLGCMSFMDFDIKVNSTVGIEHINTINPNQSEIYPNPATTQLTIDYGDQRFKNITITDNLGRIVLEITAEFQGSTTINVSDLPKGIYMLSIQTDINEQIVRKFVK
ncbi:MAG TPA: glycoside hydrolase family 76 protein [Prolixibacteraceae bacterium]|nr:glycoside hydrolase family 76 protein [Prolixibacteraceae bacterium]